MPTPKRTYGVTHDGDYALTTLPTAEFDAFTSEALGLGDISQEGRMVEALVAIFDLQGFTGFCNQPESHLVVPDFLARYLEWIFTSLKARFRHSQVGDEVRLWSNLPVFTKFMGDGLLLIWDTSKSGGLNGIHNIVSNLYEMTREYSKVFLPQIDPHFSRPPKLLRCGVARGRITSVGDDADYVGSCINVASRLQKLGSLTFAVSRAGCDFSKVKTTFVGRLVLAKVAVRGIGDAESVFLLREEVAAIADHDRDLIVGSVTEL